MNIEFSGSHTLDFDRDAISFQVEVDGVKGRCLISREALEDHFGADTEKTIEAAYSENMVEIHAVAEAKIESGMWINKELLIVTADFN